MFQNFSQLPNDPIVRLIGLYNDDPRSDKIDVGVGVFRDEHGNTPIMQAVMGAQQKLMAEEKTKSYLGLAGDLTFNAEMAELVFADSVDKARVRAMQTPGGSGALRVLADMLVQNGAKTIWVSDPTWGNHIPIFKAAGLAIKTYPYLDFASKTADEAAMLNALEAIPAGDLVLLHGCCHNPSGADLSMDTWHKISDIVQRKKILPFIDVAYQGFGQGLDEDMAGVRYLAGQVDELVIATSCSKNFGLYRERVGAALLVAKDKADADKAMTNLLAAGRASYSMPPNHGAACVALILTDAALKQQWLTELDAMRARLHHQRAALADALVSATGDSDWQVVKSHQGMFSLLCLNDETCQRLINDESIYLVSGGRINIAGFRDQAQIERFAAALAG